jgi:hypothetical protein
VIQNAMVLRKVVAYSIYLKVRLGGHMTSDILDVYGVLYGVTGVGQYIVYVYWSLTS